MTTREILVTARGLIEDPAKWRQGFCGPPGSVCAGIAIDRAAGTTDNPAQIALGLATGWDESGIAAWRHIVRWNDAASTTHAEVMAAFDRAIKAAT